MTKKDYEMVANVIVGFDNRISKWKLVQKLTNAFIMDNPDFDPGKFIVACCPVEAETEP